MLTDELDIFVRPCLRNVQLTFNVIGCCTEKLKCCVLCNG